MQRAYSPKRHNLVSCFIYPFFIGLTFISLRSYAQQANVNIESFQILKVNAASADLDIVGSNDGLSGPICFGVMARSQDGAIRSDGFRPGLFPAGKQIHVTAHVLAPTALEKPQTDFLIVELYSCGGAVIFTRKFPWTIVWTAVHTKQASTVSDDSADYSAKNPAYIFYSDMIDSDYDALDLLMVHWNDPKARDIDGEWKLDGAKYTLDYLTPKDWNALLKSVKQWRALKPRSAGAAIVEAIYWVDYAWHIRGGKYNQDVDPFAMRLFHQRLDKAEQILDQSKSFAANNPLWYATYLEAAIANKKSEKLIKKLYDEGVRKYPSYQRLHLQMASHFAPYRAKEPDWKRVDAVITRAVKLSSNTEGTTNYARLYSELSHQREVESDIVHESELQWDVMKESFEELVKRYPSARNLNDFAVFACRAEDKETFDKLRPIVKAHMVSDRWPSNYSIDTCDQFFMRPNIQSSPGRPVVFVSP